MLHETSLTGCAAAMCVDAGRDPDSEESATLYRHRKRVSTPPKPLAAPLPEDALPVGLCQRCGLVGEHWDAAACIAALRDKLAYAEMRPGMGRPRNGAPRAT